MREQRISEERGTTTLIPDVPVILILHMVLWMKTDTSANVGDIPSHLYSFSFELNPSNVNNAYTID